MKRVLVDTGPLVAIMSRTDQYHTTCVDALYELPGPLFTCWPVITEAAWLLRKHAGAVKQLLESVSNGFLELLPIEGAEATAIGKLIEKYKSIRPQLADAALLYLAERDGFDVIFTLDRRDFSVYRAGRRRAFRIIP
ncbi:MAG TPA: PIN domain-containing protein [Terriglobales bacterium]|jgi:predicted nucleic acid-binding protein|nr:PIN domain-containing protein [Terriglobales bacterium]